MLLPRVTACGGRRGEIEGTSGVRLLGGALCPEPCPPSQNRSPRPGNPSPCGLASSGLHPWHPENSVSLLELAPLVRTCEGSVERGHPLPSVSTLAWRRLLWRQFQSVEIISAFGNNEEWSSDCPTLALPLTGVELH